MSRDKSRGENCIVSCFHRGSPVEDQNLVVDRFSHQGCILFSVTLQAQTAGGQTLSMSNLLR